MSTFHPHITLHRLFRIKSELQEIYMNQILQHFAVSLIGIFIPIFIYTMGFDLMSVLLFMVFFYIGLGFLSPISGRMASKMGLKHAILYSSPLIVLYFMFMVLFEHFSSSHPLLYMIGLLGGLAFSLYWISLNSEFVKNSHKLQSGRETARLIAYPRLAAIAAPVIGAFLITGWGYDVLFFFVMIIMGLSVAPLFATNDYKSYFRFMFRDTRIRMKNKYMVAFFSRGLTFMAEGVMWPLFIFLTFDNLMAVGIAAAFSGIGVAIFTIFVGRISDRMDKRKLVKLGGLGYAFVWLSRIFITTELEVFIMSLIGSMLLAMIAVSLFASFSDDEKEGNVVSRVVSREIWLNIGRIAGLFLFMLVIGNFQFAFTVTALVSLLFLLF